MLEGSHVSCQQWTVKGFAVSADELGQFADKHMTLSEANVVHVFAGMRAPTTVVNASAPEEEKVEAPLKRQKKTPSATGPRLGLPKTLMFAKAERETQQGPSKT
jgi:hypothetical protein